MRQSEPAIARPGLRMDFDDLDHLCATVRGWNLDFRRLALKLDRGRVARIVQQHHRGMELSYARFRVSIEQIGAPPVGMLTFGVPEEGMGRLWWRGQDVEAQRLLVFPPGGELRSLSGPDFEVHTVSVATELVECLSDRFRLPLPPAATRPETFRPSSATLAELRMRLRRLRDRGPSADPLDASLVREGLVLAWLRSHEASRTRRPRSPSRVRDSAVHACLARIELGDWVDLSPSLLCDVGGVGERTLQYAFRERFGLTPAAFLKARRLAAVRSVLVQAGSSAGTVGDVAAEFGFWHVGQFAKDYRRAYGETPSRTLERSRKG